MQSFYKGLVPSRLLYALPLLSIAPPQWKVLETFHRKALRGCLGVPRLVGSTAVLLDAQDSPLRLHPEARALERIGRFQGKRSSSSFLENLLSHRPSQTRLFAQKFRSEIEFTKISLPALPPPFRALGYIGRLQGTRSSSSLLENLLSRS